MIVIDLDNFKFFNDVYGHLAGDQVLRQVANTLRECCDSPEFFLARFGGDEFGLLLPGRTHAQGTELIARVRECLDRIGYCPPGCDTLVPLSVSCGLALMPEGGPSYLEALETADERLHRDKVGDQDYQTKPNHLRDEVMRTVDGFVMLDARVTAVDNKDRYTRGHSEDVMRYCVAIARQVDLPKDELRLLQVAALLHDVGKIMISDHILRMPGKLSEVDYDAVKQHTVMGALLVGSIPGLVATHEAVHFHHERWDGDGYLKGLRGEQIPAMARIMAVADGCSAMTMDRPYRKGFSQDVVREIFEKDQGH